MLSKQDEEKSALVNFRSGGNLLMPTRLWSQSGGKEKINGALL